jgi:hypothetical protein
MAEIKSKLPIEIVGIKTKSTSEGGIMYMVDNGQDHRITPVLPGRVTKIDGDEVYISHKEYIKEDYVSIYVIDGKIEVKKGQEVLQSTTIGVTDEEVELKIKHKGSFIDAKSFIGKTFNQSKGVTMSAKERARCIVKNLVGVPQTALGYKKEDDPCAFYKDEEEPTEPDDDVEDAEPKDDEVKKDNDWSFFDDDNDDEEDDDDNLLGSAAKMLGGGVNEQLNEEISRIKELLNI